jgi:precorrin-2 dehydrogenase/sirohydrochlorin ferrochelatase
MIPLLHDFTGQTVLVFGGGSVGARKARRFAREAAVLVVSPSFADADFGGGERVRAAPDPADVPAWLDRVDPALVVAATDDEALNAAIAAAARDRDVLVNRTDEHGDREWGSVVVPATVRDGPVTVAISTDGTSPALSRHLREQIEPVVANAGAMATLAGDIREELQERYDPAERRAALRAVVRDDAVWKGLDSPGSNPRQRASDVITDVTGDSS